MSNFISQDGYFQQIGYLVSDFKADLHPKEKPSILGVGWDQDLMESDPIQEALFEDLLGNFDARFHLSVGFEEAGKIGLELRKKITLTIDQTVPEFSRGFLMFAADQTRSEIGRRLFREREIKIIVFDKEKNTGYSEETDAGVPFRSVDRSNRNSAAWQGLIQDIFEKNN